MVPSSSSAMTKKGEGTSTSSPYCVSARRYRPKTLGDLLGQEALVKTLSNAILRGRIPHAFIFTGIRGIGKTTTARILARSLNCIGPDGQGQETLNPCGHCESCEALNQDRHLDVLEMDAASRTGVDDIREVIESARYKAVSSRYKIYIIDEVHMLSKSAFNALLKTLEEPPPHVKFIFATTEIRKVPQTVLSRCMRFDLKRLNHKELITLFQQVCAGEGVTFEDHALSLLAQAAEGSARDGLSILDQVMTTAQGHVHADLVRNLLGISEPGGTLSLLEKILGGHVPQSLEIFQKLYEAGGDPLYVLRDLLDLLHTLTLMKVAPDMDYGPTLSPEETKTLQGLSQRVSIPMLTRLWQMVNKGIEEVQKAPSPLQAVRMILVRLGYVKDLPSPEEMIKLLRGASSSPKSLPENFGERPVTQGKIAPLQEESPPSLIPMPEPMVSKSVLNLEAIPGIPDDTRHCVCPSPPSFQEMVALFYEREELLLHAHLLHDVCLISYAPGSVVLNLKPEAPKDLVSKMRHFLELWTGRTWGVRHCASQEGEDSLFAQEKTRQETLTARLKETPMVKAALEFFPGAAIESIVETNLSLVKT